MRPLPSAIDFTMCCTQAKSPLLSVGKPANARPHGSLSQISRPHCSNENGGLAITYLAYLPDVLILYDFFYLIISIPSPFSACKFGRYCCINFPAEVSCGPCQPSLTQKRMR